jgi:hypothetical protein
MDARYADYTPAVERTTIRDYSILVRLLTRSPPGLPAGLGSAGDESRCQGDAAASSGPRSPS